MVRVLDGALDANVESEAFGVTPRVALAHRSTTIECAKEKPDGVTVIVTGAGDEPIDAVQIAEYAVLIVEFSTRLVNVAPLAESPTVYPALLSAAMTLTTISSLATGVND